ncbi:uncharacterized protein BHQ10_007510 [Talaromyces amestolkiae]|uniref:Ferric reductase NAD binding domain-containing protein n=1 Tax=Talaromyces amestolkiae TaxID=1196081 RepID=A0A364L6Q4_TALAM|nr:uncharacterized protein BHQ10_007510 [Talaromyces amestolkiae]RAO71498.1 hypothetical protein BHQ10_007510 [Talaromyces amestolkiae]
MHPFVITWWNNNESGEMESFTLLVKPRSGFTNRLKMLPSTRYRVWIDGPYGPDRDLGTPISDYGHIFMVATGIGIGAQIPYIKQLLEGYRRGVVRTQKIVLIWQMDLEADYDDVQDWLQELVSEDSGYHFRVRIFNPSLRSSQDPHDVGQHELIKIWGGNVDWREELREELQKQVGNMLITVSANAGVRDVFRRMARKHQSVDLLELEFQPWEWKRSFWSYF